MQIEWKSDKVSPYLSREVAEWPGLRIHRAHVMPGRMLEHTNDFHEINVALSGSLTTEKLSSGGRVIRTTGNSGNLCITPAGQSMSARWDKPLQNLGMFFQTGFISSVAAENGFSPEVEFVEVYKDRDPLVQTLGGDPEDSGSISGAMHRGWINIKSVVTGRDEAAILNECERGEDVAKESYKQAMEMELPGYIREVVENQYQGVLAAHDNIKALRNAANNDKSSTASMTS